MSSFPLDVPIDDCPICRAQRRADREGRGLTMQEYISASREALDKGVVE